MKKVIGCSRKKSVEKVECRNKGKKEKAMMLKGGVGEGGDK